MSNPLEGKTVKYVTTSDLNFVAAIALVDPYKPRTFKIFCSGTLVSSRHIVTNEHCLQYQIPENIEIYVGSHDLNEAQKFSTTGWALFSKWVKEKRGEPLSLTYDDFAIMRLNEEVDLNRVTPTKIHWSTYKELEGTTVEMAGWGSVENDFASQYMRRAKVQIIDQAACAKRSNLRSIETGLYFCSHSRSCVLAGYGDSGSPLLDSRNRVIGITSATCQNIWEPENTFNLHVNITFYKEFLKDVLISGSVYNHQQS